MINEVYRILKHGGQAIFSIWGKSEEFNYFNSYRDTIELVQGIKTKMANFNMHDDQPKAYFLNIIF